MQKLVPILFSIIMEKYERFLYFLILCGKGHVSLKMKLIKDLNTTHLVNNFGNK